MFIEVYSIILFRNTFLMLFFLFFRYKYLSDGQVKHDWEVGFMLIQVAEWPVKLHIWMND